MKCSIIKDLLVSFLQVLFRVFFVFPINHNKVVMYPVNGKYYCNLKYIYEEMSDRLKNNTYWIASDSKGFSENGIENICKPGSLRAYYHIFTAHIIIFNSGFYSFVPKRKGQVWIETWHGGGAYKKIDSVFVNLKDTRKRKRVLKVQNNIDYVVSSCEAFSSAYRLDAGAFNAKFLDTGMPRNDIFFKKYQEAIKEKVIYRYGTGNNENIVLYAPTFRDDDRNSDLKVDALLDRLESVYECKFNLYLRCHPHIKSKIFNNVVKDERIVDVSDYPDMQELLYVADILITDYSSCMWDFSLSYKPCFIYAYDLRSYENERNFYTPINKWPFPLAVNNKELLTNISNFNEATYVEAVRKHHMDLGSYENGCAAEKVCKIIEVICEGVDKRRL